MYFLRWFFYSLLFFGVMSCSIAVYALDENGHTKAWCQPKGGEVDHIFSDGTRPDCLLPEIAVETEWAKPVWKCGPGQAIHYAIQSGQDPAVLLIMDGKESQKYYEQLKTLQKRVFFLTDDGELVRLKIFTMEKLP